MGNVSFRFDQSADTVYEWVRDPDVIKRRGTALGEREIVVRQEGNAVLVERTVDAEVPSFAKKLFKPTNRVHETKDWDPATRSAKLLVDIKGTPVSIEGTIRIVPDGDGCLYNVDYTVKCSIPLIGKKLAEYVDGLTAKGMRDEYEWSKRELDARD
ncbi:MAG: DUF2505 domain-containing protein [Sandaracinaceae bacterium]|nr:DUF2505 domain-containing protein [Sandaracinaceae bacterium]